MVECFKIGLYGRIEISHPPEAIEMVEMEVHSRLVSEDNPNGRATYFGSRAVLFGNHGNLDGCSCVSKLCHYIELPYCTKCGLFVKGE